MQLKSALHAVLLLGLGLAGVACSDSPTAPEPFDVNDVVFAEELAVTVADLQETESGLYYYDVVSGQGPEATDQSTLEIHYALWLEDGTLLYDSREVGETEEFDLSAESLIPGFEEGVLAMSEGGTRVLVLPPELAYGQSGTQGIPPNTGLVFRVELITVTTPS